MSPVTDDPTARTAAAAWASILSTGFRLRPLPRATHPVWRVESDTGPALVLKQLPQYPAGVEPMVEFRVLAHLQRAGVSVAPPIVTDAGAIVATVDRRAWTLSPELPHRPGCENDPGVAHAVGSAIGRLGRALTTVPWPVPSYVDDPVVVLDEVLPQLDPGVVDGIRPLVPRLRSTCADLPTQLTHGDCNAGNVLISPDGGVGFIDLDHLPSGPRIRDLAYYLVSNLGRRLTDPTVDRAVAGWASELTVHLDGFHQEHPITEQERSALVPLMLVTEIAGAHWSLHGWEPDPAAHRRSLTTLAWLSARFDELQARATTA